MVVMTAMPQPPHKRADHGNPNRREDVDLRLPRGRGRGHHHQHHRNPHRQPHLQHGPRSNTNSPSPGPQPGHQIFPGSVFECLNSLDRYVSRSQQQKSLLDPSYQRLQESISMEIFYSGERSHHRLTNLEKFKLADILCGYFTEKSVKESVASMCERFELLFIASDQPASSGLGGTMLAKTQVMCSTISLAVSLGSTAILTAFANWCYQSKTKPVTIKMACQQVCDQLIKDFTSHKYIPHADEKAMETENEISLGASLHEAITSVPSLSPLLICFALITVTADSDVMKNKYDVLQGMWPSNTIISLVLRCFSVESGQRISKSLESADSRTFAETVAACLATVVLPCILNLCCAFVDDGQCNEKSEPIDQNLISQLQCALLRLLCASNSQKCILSEQRMVRVMESLSEVEQRHRRSTAFQRSVDRIAQVIQVSVTKRKRMNVALLQESYAKLKVDHVLLENALKTAA